MIRETAAALALLATVGCAGGGVGLGPAPIRGQARNVEDPTRSVVEVYRTRPHLHAERVPGARTVPDPDGGFRTALLPRGNYIVVLRLPDQPPAFSKASVPGPRIALTPREGPGPAAIEIRAATSSQADAACTLSQADASGPIADHRDVRLRGGAPIVVGGLAAGRWRLDVPSSGATLELVLIGGPLAERVVVAPPSQRPGATLTGRVTRDGSPVAGVVVAVRPLVDGLLASRTWGRYALTESDGGYRIADVPAGPARIRVESRDVPIRLAPAPVDQEIPPSGDVSQDFAIGL